MMLKSLLPKEVKVNNTIDDIGKKSNLNTNQTSVFIIKSFLLIFLGSTEPHSGPLGDIDGFVQLIPGKKR